MFGLKRAGGVLAMILAATTPVLAQQPSPAGHIKISSGSAFIVRQNTTIPARLGELVFATDALRTGADGALGVTLKDDTRLSLGRGRRLLVSLRLSSRVHLLKNSRDQGSLRGKG